RVWPSRRWAWRRSMHRDFGDHPLRYVRRAALAIADEAQQGVLARLVEIELGDLLGTGVDPGGVGHVCKVQRRVGASVFPERLAHLGQRRAGLVVDRDHMVRLRAGVREL